mmetsp:Transcript_28748/g.83134  ORF Transcript_28748/g.83134 Transcript_28748/m.83134 type:complete len:249 (-) Transcript_28748:3-749(-)
MVHQPVEGVAEDPHRLAQEASAVQGRHGRPRRLAREEGGRRQGQGREGQGRGGAAGGGQGGGGGAPGAGGRGAGRGTRGGGGRGRRGGCEGGPRHQRRRRAGGQGGRRGGGGGGGVPRRRLRQARRLRRERRPRRGRRHAALRPLRLRGLDVAVAALRAHVARACLRSGRRRPRSKRCAHRSPALLLPEVLQEGAEPQVLRRGDHAGPPGPHQGHSGDHEEGEGRGAPVARRHGVPWHLRDAHGGGPA